MTKQGRLLSIFILILISIFLYQTEEWEQLPIVSINSSPSEGPRFSEEDGLHFKRQEWWDQLHRTPEGVNWRQLEYLTQMKRHEKRRELLSFRSEDCYLSLPEANLKGNWEERGSTNQAGSIFRTTYEPDLDEIWLISAGGSLWKGHRQTLNWTVVNQDLQFDPMLLAFIPTR